MASRQTRGRQRIPMRLIQNQDDLYASFSKRRLGLFKKGSELSTLCGADVGIIVFSPTDNPFSFFSPNMDSVVDRYHHPGRPLKHSVRAIDSHTRTRIDALNKRLDELTEEKVKLKAHEAQLEEADKERERGWWEETAVDDLSKEQVKEWTAWFESFKFRVENKMAQIQNGPGSSASALNGGGAWTSPSIPSFPAPTPYYAAAAEQFGGGQYLGVGTQDQDSRAAAMNVYGGGGGGLGQYLLSSPPLDPFFPRTMSVGGASSSSHVFSPPFRLYMSPEGPDPFAAGSSGGGGESEQPAAECVDESGGSGRGKGVLAFLTPSPIPTTNEIPYTNFCETPPNNDTVGAEAVNPSVPNQGQGEGRN